MEFNAKIFNSETQQKIETCLGLMFINANHWVILMQTGHLIVLPNLKKIGLLSTVRTNYCIVRGIQLKKY